MNDEQLLRYSRHILLPTLDIAGQQRLLDSRVLLIGLGGLGSPAALYLAASGVGHLRLVDADRVELSNLQRQVIHSQARIGQCKVESAAAGIAELNPDVEVETFACRADMALLDRLVPGVDLVLDCCDNAASRRVINATTRRHGVPMVSAAAIGWEGQLAVFDPRDPQAACYECLYPDTGNDDEVTAACAHSGIAAPVVGTMGVLQALQALKLLCGVEEVSAGELLVFDGLRLDFQRLRIGRREDCPGCRDSE